TRSPARRLAPRRLSAALHHGDFHPDAVCHGSQTCPFSKWHRLQQSRRRWHPGFLTLDRAVPGYRWLKSVTGSSYACPRGLELACLHQPRGRTLLNYENYAVIHHASSDAGGKLFLDCFHRSHVGKTEGKTPWKITGQLEEACSCDAACPCWFDSKPTKMTCSGGQVLFIEKGTYGKVKLDGLAMANMSQSPEGQTMMGSFGNWNFSYNYIDEKANPEQRKALKAIANVVLVPGASKKTETRYVAITRKTERKDHEISLGQYGTFRGHLLEGGLGG